MDNYEELIIYDADIKKEFPDPLSVEEVPLNDPLAARTDAQSEESSVTIKQEKTLSWRTPEAENEASQHVATDSCHSENIPARPNCNNTSYSVNKKQGNGEPPAQSLAEFLSSTCLQSPSPPGSPLDAVALSYCAGASNLCIDQESSNASETRPNDAESNSPEIIYVDSDSENERRDSQAPSSNVDSDSGAGSRNIEVSESSGGDCAAENLNNGSLKNHTYTTSTAIFKLFKLNKEGNKTKTKKEQSNSSAALSSRLPLLPAAEPVTTKQSTARLESFVRPTGQAQQTLPASQHMLGQSQQTMAPSHTILAVNQHDPLQNQQTWTPIHQLLALSRQLLNQQQQSVTASHGSQFLSQQTVTSAQAPQLLTQHSLPPQQQFVPSVQPTTSQSVAMPPSVKKLSSVLRAKNPKLASKTVNASVTETADKPQAGVKRKNLTESEYINLKNKLTVHELKLRLRNAKIKAELQESELKLKLEASNQDLSNKKLKHDILSAKLQFYSKLCATEKS